MTPPRTVALTERRPAVRRVPRADAADLAVRFGHVVEILPTADRGVYRLTARGYTGWFRTPTVRWVVRPKLPWADLTRLVAGHDPRPSGTDSAAADPVPADFADLLAARLADLMRERAAVGLLHGYRERAVESAEVRGRIDFAEQARRYPPGGLFPVVADEFTPDVAWNRVPAAAARVLLASPDLSPAKRSDLGRATAAFAGISDAPPSPTDWDRLTFDARTEPYRRLIGWCRLVLGAADAGGAGGGLLLNLEHLFQTHVGSVLDSPHVRTQAAFTLEPIRGPATPVTLRPDFVVAKSDGTMRAVWDAKWKPLTAAGPHPADAQQVLAYAAALGVPTAGLVYPGRTSAVREYRTPSGVRLVAARLRLAGPAERCARSADRLRRLVFGRRL